MKKFTGIDTVAGLFLICVFTAVVFLSLAYGAGVYKNVSQVMEQQYESRTAIGYVTSKVHAGDTAGGVSLGELDGVPALILSETWYDIRFDTYIYCYQGSIMELYGPAGEDFTPQSGQKVVQAQSLDFSLEGDLLRVSCTTGSGTAVTYVQVAALEGGGV